MVSLATQTFSSLLLLSASEVACICSLLFCQPWSLSAHLRLWFLYLLSVCELILPCLTSSNSCTISWSKGLRAESGLYRQFFTASQSFHFWIIHNTYAQSGHHVLSLFKLQEVTVYRTFSFWLWLGFFILSGYVSRVLTEEGLALVRLPGGYHYNKLNAFLTYCINPDQCSLLIWRIPVNNP